MIILGIDPGTATTGWGVIEYSPGATKKANGKKEDWGEGAYRDFGLILTPKEEKMENRLLILYQGLMSLFARVKPDCVVVEQLFFGVNSRTAMTVGQARGVVMLTAAANGVDFFEYQGLQVKRILTESGKADKKQIQEAVRQKLKMKEFTKPKDQNGKETNTFLDDAVDALAIAICHIEKTYLDKV
jgi:crossover junction endodeoxyribonuclease RuvC